MGKGKDEYCVLKLASLLREGKRSKCFMGFGWGLGGALHYGGCFGTAKSKSMRENRTTGIEAWGRAYERGLQLEPSSLLEYLKSKDLHECYIKIWVL